MTKEQSAQVRGAAILLMLWHHFFLDPSLYPDGFFLHAALAAEAARFGKICVGLFTFVSGYGMYKTMQRASGGGLGGMIRTALSRSLSLYVRYWYVLLLLVVVPAYFLDEPFTGREMLLHLSALQPDRIGAAWYVFQYLVLMLVAPFLYLLSEIASKESDGKRRMRALLVCVALAALLLFAYILFPALRPAYAAVRVYARPLFLLIFVSGFLWARFGKERRLPLAAGLLSLLAAVVLRVLFSDSAADARCDLFVVPLFIAGFLRCTGASKAVAGFFAWCGAHSQYLWLVHLAVFARTRLICERTGEAILFYLTQLILSLAVSLLMEKGEQAANILLQKVKKKGISAS